MALRSLSICAGIGGIDVGLAAWCRTVCYVEREAFVAAVLVARMEEASLDPAPIWGDLSTFDGRPWRGRVDLVTGGYPCQPFSLAGSRLGADDPRHLWPHVRRIVGEVRPSLVFFENVAGHVSLGLEDVVRDLEGMGYRVAATLVTAAEVGAPHRRERVFIMGQLADADVGRRQGVGRGGLLDGIGQAHGHDADGCSGRGARHLGNALGAGLEVGEPRPVAGSFPAPWPPGPADAEAWGRLPAHLHPATESDLCGMVDGVPAWMDGAVDRARILSSIRADRIRALGNAVVPACAAAAFRLLLGELVK